MARSGQRGSSRQRGTGKRLTCSEVLQCSSQPVLTVLLTQLPVQLRRAVASTMFAQETYHSDVAGVPVNSMHCSMLVSELK